MRELALLVAVLAAAALAACSVSSAQQAQAMLTWSAPTSYTDGTGIPAGSLTFNVYEGAGGPGTEGAAPVQTAVTGTTATVDGLQANANTCFEVTAVSGAGVESARSNEACKSTVVAGTYPPRAPSGLTVQ